jgi:hypothetical protein
MSRRSVILAYVIAAVLLAAGLVCGVVALDKRYWQDPVFRKLETRNPSAPKRRTCRACDDARPWKWAAVGLGAAGVTVALATFVLSRRRSEDASDSPET